MKITIKTLKNEQFPVEIETTDSFNDVKQKIEKEKPELAASKQKLIYAGKVLANETLVSDSGLSENDFIVCMVTNPAKPKAAGVSTNPSPSSATTAAAAPAPASPAPAVAAAAPLSTPLPAPQASIPPAAPRAQTQTLNPEAIRQLTDMGFPQDQAEAALRAAMGNSDLAVEYLMNGIPDNARRAAISTPSGAGTPSASGGSASSLDQFRRHPQFNELRRMIQQNPSALPQVLEAIGQQDPELLRVIHANQAEFIQLMNEPITEQPPQNPDFGAGGGAGGDMPNPMQLIQMIQMLPPDQREAAAQSLGMTSEQLQAFSQMIASLPPDQLQRLMRESGAGGAGGGAGGFGGPPPGANVIRLTEEEMAAVNRLVELGFNQQDAVAAYLACDKNEALAANLLLEGWGADNAGGGGF